MRIIRSIPAMHRFSKETRQRGKSLGLIPTMGCLHEGHLSLVKAARKENDVVVVSIFVNPIQFGPKEDYKKYPRDLSHDKKLLKGVDVIFLPAAKDVFPKKFRTYIEVEGLSDKLCGLSRPGHFRGVATIVAKLLNIVAPDRVYFGEKDFQQQVIIKQMVKDLNLDIEVRTRPTKRESNGLAMSSRNKHLSSKEKKAATALYQALKLAKDLIKRGERDPKKILNRMRKVIQKEPKIKIDYISICDPQTLEPVRRVDKKALIALAAYIGKTRLIDNLMVGLR